MFVALISFFSMLSYGQGVVEGVVTDAITGESLIGVNIVYEVGKGVRLTGEASPLAETPHHPVGPPIHHSNTP